MLDYRLYRPDSPGPHPVTVYFHGGGWVLGDHTSDDAFCRDLCVNTNSIIISANYRHAPEAPFPAAADDGFAAVKWASGNIKTLGGIAGELAVCGWSAGGNIAAVVCQLARDAGGPAIKGQVLITPVVDAGDEQPIDDRQCRRLCADQGPDGLVLGSLCRSIRARRPESLSFARTGSFRSPAGADHHRRI